MHAMAQSEEQDCPLLGFFVPPSPSRSTLMVPDSVDAWNAAYHSRFHSRHDSSPSTVHTPDTLPSIESPPFGPPPALFLPRGDSIHSPEPRRLDSSPSTVNTP